MGRPPYGAWDGLAAATQLHLNCVRRSVSARPRQPCAAPDSVATRRVESLARRGRRITQLATVSHAIVAAAARPHFMERPQHKPTLAGRRPSLVYRSHHVRPHSSRAPLRYSWRRIGCAERAHATPDRNCRGVRVRHGGRVCTQLADARRPATARVGISGPRPTPHPSGANRREIRRARRLTMLGADSHAIVAAAARPNLMESLQ